MAKLLMRIMTLTISVLMVLIYTFSIDLENVYAGDPYARITSSAISGSPPKLNVTVSFSATPESGATYSIHMVAYQVQPKTGPKAIYEKPISPGVSSVSFSVDLPGKDKGTYRIDVDLRKKSSSYPNGYFLQVGEYKFITYTPETADTPGAADKGTLIIYSRPEKGARVYINGAYKGDTDLGMKLAPGKVEIKLTKDGYADFNTTETVVSGKTTEEILVMTPLPVGQKPVIKSFSVAIPSRNLKAMSGEVIIARPAEPIILEWEVYNTDSVEVDKIGGIRTPFPNKIQLVPQEKDIIPTGVLNAPGDSRAYVIYYTLYAYSLGGTAEKTVQVNIRPLTLEEIFNEYEKWGNLGYTWADGTHDDKALVGPGLRGATTSFWVTMAWLSGTPSQYSRYDCNAMQYKSLVFLNQLETQGKLFGWNYMPVSGTSYYPEHQAVAIWQDGTTWQTDGEILDPHGAQKPAHYGTASGWAGFFPWEPSGAYSEAYPDIPGGEAARNHKYQFNEFDSNTATPNGGRWGNGTGAKTPWEGKTWRQQVSEFAGWMVTPHIVAMECPVDVLITNSSGQRLGVLPDGKWVREFNPLDFYFYKNEEGDKQWFFALPKDTYRVSIEGTGSGSFNVLSCTGGKEVYSYGSNPISKGGVATLTLDHNNPTAPLALPDGKKVTPKEVSNEELVPVQQPGLGQKTVPDKQPGPGQPDEPEELEIDFITLIIGLVGTVVVAAVVIIFIRRRIARASLARSDTTQVQQDEISMKPQIKALPSSASASQIQNGIPRGKSGYNSTSLEEPSLHPEGLVCVKCDRQNPPWARYCTWCGQEAESVPDSRPDSAICDKCGSTHPLWAQFCNKCGNKFENVEESKPRGNKCNMCGNINPAEANFCNRCGLKTEAEPATRVCPVCSDPVVESEVFCTQCGTALEAEAKIKFCPNCGDPIAENEKFCNKCGRKDVGERVRHGN